MFVAEESHRDGHVEHEEEFIVVVEGQEGNGHDGRWGDVFFELLHFVLFIHYGVCCFARSLNHLNYAKK